MQTRDTAVKAFTLLLALPYGAQALEPIPKESGVSGFVNVGVGAAVVESNQLAEAIGQELGDERIDSLDSPDDQSVGLPVFAFEISYTFDSAKTQIYAGNLLEDYLRFDLTTRVGVRQDIGGWGRLGLSAFTTPLTTEVWENPYLVGMNRDTTDRETTGARVSWDNIFGSGLEIRLSGREVDIDDEMSGAGLGLSDAEIALLDRNGDINQANIRYSFKLGEGNRLVVGWYYTEFDLDGDALSRDGSLVEVNWLYAASSRLRFVTNLGAGFFDYDEVHPVFGDKADKDRIALSVTGFYQGLFGLQNWVANASLIYSEDDSDIDFYDSSIGMVTFGLLRKF